MNLFSFQSWWILVFFGAISKLHSLASFFSSTLSALGNVDCRKQANPSAEDVQLAQGDGSWFVFAHVSAWVLNSSSENVKSPIPRW